MNYELARTFARAVAMAALGNAEHVRGVVATGEFSAGIRIKPPPQSIKRIQLIIVSFSLVSKYLDMIRSIRGTSLDCRPASVRFEALREVLRYEIGPEGARTLADPLQPFADDGRLWRDTGDGSQPILDLHMLSEDWAHPDPSFATNLCSRQLLAQMKEQAVPFVVGLDGGKFRVKQEEIRAVNEML